MNEEKKERIKRQIVLFLVKIYLGLIKYELTLIVIYNFYMGFCSCSLHISLILHRYLSFGFYPEFVHISC